MMERQRRDQGRLFYEFRLEDRIPENHLLRRMNALVTVALADLHKELEPYYSEIGRPSIDPELMIRMLIIGYCYGIRYLAAVPDCRACPLKPKCCPGMPSRRIVRDLDEDARDVARCKMTTKTFLSRAI